jgi:hypothetical protein
VPTTSLNPHPQILSFAAAEAYRKVLSVTGCISAYYCSAAARLSLITFGTDEDSGEHLRLIAESLSRDPDHVETLDAKVMSKHSGHSTLSTSSV